eukprot:m.332267 g.332267  ORF g.332267 m.332267 type:complete len:354 (+) comp16912_c0_seq1:305-1366(+)
MLKIITLVVAAVVVADASDGNIENLNQLYSVLQNGENKKVGFLSDGNYHTNQHLLPPSTIPLIMQSVGDLEAAVENDTLVAALMTGMPSEEFHSFSNDLVTLQAPLFGTGPNSTDLIKALDAATVRIIEDGTDVEIAKRNPPFELIGVHTCGASGAFEFPPTENATGLLKEVLDTGILKVAALGPYDWEESGNYTDTSNPTGFWPEFMTSVLIEINKAYPNHNITLERVWRAGSDSTLDLVHSEAAYMSEPYFLVSGYYPSSGGISRKAAFDVGCTILGKDSKFFTKKHYPVLPEQNFTTVESSVKEDGNVSTGLIIGIAVAGGVALLGIIAAVILIRNEKKGKPIFSQLYEA